LSRLSVPASVTLIEQLSLQGSRSPSIGIEIEEGSISLGVPDELLVDFEVRSLVYRYVVDSPQSIVIPSSIEELPPVCSFWEEKLRTVDYEPDSKLRLI
jgi:hypothetical protein